MKTKDGLVEAIKKEHVRVVAFLEQEKNALLRSVLENRRDDLQELLTALRAHPWEESEIEPFVARWEELFKRGLSKTLNEEGNARLHKTASEFEGGLLAPWIENEPRAKAAIPFAWLGEGDAKYVNLLNGEQVFYEETNRQIRKNYELYKKLKTNSEYGKANRWRPSILGFGQAYVAIGAIMCIVVRPQLNFIGKRLVVSSSCAPSFMIRDICVGHESIFLTTTDSIPATAFPEIPCLNHGKPHCFCEICSKLRDKLNLKWPICQVGMDIRITVVNTSQLAPCYFTAALWGEAEVPSHSGEDCRSVCGNCGSTLDPVTFYCPKSLQHAHP